MKGTQPGLFLLVAVVVAGCSSSQMRRIDAERDVYESWPIEMRQAVLDGKVEVGMTPEMVRMALGKPTEIVSRSTMPGDDEIWVYRKGGDSSPNPMMGGPMIGTGGTVGGVGISSGRGGTSIAPIIGTGIDLGMGGISMGSGGGMGSGGMMPMPMPLPPTPVEEREVIFRSGVVYRADAP